MLNDPTDDARPRHIGQIIAYRIKERFFDANIYVAYRCATAEEYDKLRPEVEKLLGFAGIERDDYEDDGVFGLYFYSSDDEACVDTGEWTPGRGEPSWTDSFGQKVQVFKEAIARLGGLILDGKVIGSDMI